MMTLDVPSWVKGRQAKVEEISTGTYRITGPNLAEGVAGVRMTDDLRWQAFVRDRPDGPDLAVSDPTVPTAREALAIAFELYRQQNVV
jgi:hypothetical protein